MSAIPTIDSIPLPWQAAAWDALVKRVSGGTLPHGLLITGQAGVGKTLFAVAFARYALCREPKDGRACGRCHSCAQFAAGTHPDYKHVSFEERERKAGEEGALKANISVEQIRELIGGLQLRSHTAGGRKLALIDPAEGMSPAAANSLLKTLEEPPPDTVLVLVSAAPGRLPATIRSRCQVLSLAVPDADSALRWLDSAAARPDWPLLLGFAGGAPLAALTLADGDIGARRKAFFEALSRLKAGQANPVMLAAHPKDDYPELLRFLWSYTSDLIRIKHGDTRGIVNRDQLPLLQKTAEGIHLRSLHAYLDRVQATMQALDSSANRELNFEVLLADWADGFEEIKNSPLAAHTTWGWT